MDREMTPAHGSTPDRQPASASVRRVAGGGGGVSAIAREPWVGAAVVAKHLAVTEFWVREMARNGSIPATKIGAYWRFRISDVDDAMLARRSEVKVRRK